MNLGYLAATFALVVPAELPDKTFVSSVILSSRHRPAPVWVGASSGLVAQAGIAVAAGRLLALAPHRVVAGVTAALFLAGACYLLVTTEQVDEAEGAELAEIEEVLLVAEEVADAAATSAGGGGIGADREARRRFLRIAGTSFAVVFLAEFGDLTQILIANLAARYRDPVSVFCGAAVAFMLIAGVGVAAGRTLLRIVPLTLIRRLSGLAMAGLGIWSLVDALS